MSARVYTDGSYNPRTRCAGAGVLLEDEARGIELQASVYLGQLPSHLGNDLAEITAAIYGLEWADASQGVTLVTDSVAVLCATRGGASRWTGHEDFAPWIAKLARTARPHALTVRRVTAHIPFTPLGLQMADDLAKRAMRRQETVLWRIRDVEEVGCDAG